MLPVLERFGGKPVQCCFPSPHATGSNATTKPPEPKPVYIFDFARMREGPPAGTVNKLAGSGLAVVPATTPGATATASHDTSNDEAGPLHPEQHPAHAAATTALALVPATENDGEHAAAPLPPLPDHDGGGGDDDHDDYWSAKAYLEEKRHRFSRAPLHHLQMAGALGLVNLVGAMWLLDQPRLFPPPTARVLAVVSRVLAWYAWSFLLLPLLRLALIARWNRGLKRRNALRRFLHIDFKARGADASTEVHRKLEIASRYRACVMRQKARHAVVGGGMGAF